jgi:ribonuclease HI
MGRNARGPLSWTRPHCGMTSSPVLVWCRSSEGCPCLFCPCLTSGSQRRLRARGGAFAFAPTGTFGAGAAAILVAPSKVRTCYATRLDFSCTNNIVEYEALLLGLRKLKTMGIRRVILKIDSQVISGHVDKSSKGRDPKLEKYLDTVRRLEASFEGFSVKNTPRGENEHADLLAKSAAQGLPLPLEVFFETIKAPSIELMERAVLTISPVHSEDWRTEIISFLQGNCLSDNEVYNKRMEARTRPYVMIEGELYKHGVCSPLLKCLSRTEVIKLMKEIHAGLCGSHIGSRPLLGKVFRQGFYWPKAASDAADLVKKGKNYQKCAKDQRQPSSLTQLIQPTWPLQRWGLICWVHFHHHKAT